MANKKYFELLKDPRWQKKRLEILQRDEFMCRSCYDKDSSLQIHHLSYSYNGNPWDVDNDKLLTVCENCHKQFSDANKAVKDSIAKFKEPDYIFDASKIIDFMSDCNPNVGSNILKFLEAYYKMDHMNQTALIKQFECIIAYNPEW